MTKKKTPTPEALESLSDIGRAELEQTGEMPTASAVAPDTVATPDGLCMRLAYVLTDMHAMQHARALAGGGGPSQWQNAMRYVGLAIECLETQARTDTAR